MPDLQYALVLQVRRARVNFELLLGTLVDVGYVLEGSTTCGCSFTQTALESVTQEDFDHVFEFFYPDEHNDVVLQFDTTDEGGTRGAYTLALYNANVVQASDVRQALLKHNANFNRA